jgi:hypothetical protein
LKPAVLLLLLLFAPTHFARQVAPDSQEVRKQNVEEISTEDKAEIIKLTLERALVAKAIPDYNIIEKQDSFLLSKENLTPELIPQIERVTLVPLTPEEIKELANSRGDYVYYFRFKEFKVEGSKVVVSLDNIPMYAEKPTRMAFGGGFTIEYVKQDGKWVGKLITSWIV